MQRGRVGTGPEPVPIRIISRIDGKDLGQDGGVMGTLRFAHPTGLLRFLLPGEWRFPLDRGVPPRRKGLADRAWLCSQLVDLGEGATGAGLRAQGG